MGLSSVNVLDKWNVWPHDGAGWEVKGSPEDRNSSCWDQECVYHMSWQSIQELSRHFSLNQSGILPALKNKNCIHLYRNDNIRALHSCLCSITAHIFADIAIFALILICILIQSSSEAFVVCITDLMGREHGWVWTGERTCLGTPGLLICTKHRREKHSCPAIFCGPPSSMFATFRRLWSFD